MAYESTPEDKNRAYLLGVIYVVLAIFLALMLFKIWPPTPWPKDAEVRQDEELAKALAECKCPQPSPSPTPSPSPSVVNTGSGSSTIFPATPQTSPAASPRSSPVVSPAGSPAASPTGSLAASSTSSPSPARLADGRPSPVPSDALASMPIKFLGLCLMTSFDERLLLLVIIAGMLGAFIHGATSLADFVGNNKFNKRWTWFYLLRPAIGMALALVFYFVIRGGFLTTSGGAKDINPYGIAALAGLVGMFSKQATDKLGEVFGTLFRSAEGEGDAKRKDPLKPTTTITIQKIEPAEVVAGTTPTSIEVTGTDFTSTSKVWLDDKPQETKFVSATSLVAIVADALTATPRTFKLKVVNSEDAESTEVEFKVITEGQRSAAGSVTGEQPVHGEGFDDEVIDGCDVELKADTGDEELPITEGGVE